MKDNRYLELRQMLKAKRDELAVELRNKTRAIVESGSSGELRRTGDTAEQASQNTSEDLEFTLIQMKNDTLHKYSDALIRLAAESYGICDDCGEEISVQRLWALHFAVRCLACQKAVEDASAKSTRNLMHSRRQSVFLDE